MPQGTSGHKVPPNEPPDTSGHKVPPKVVQALTEEAEHVAKAVSKLAEKAKKAMPAPEGE